MMSTIQRIIALFFFCYCFSLTAQVCSAAENHLRFLWPAPPKTPKLEFLGVYSSDGDLPKTNIEEAWNKFAGKTKGDHALWQPTSITTLTDGRILITELGLGDIKVFDLAKSEVNYLFQPDLPLFQKAIDIAVDGQGRFYVADQKAKAISVFDSDLTPLYQIGSELGLARLEKIAVNDRLQIIYLSDSTLNKVFAVDFTGKLLFEIGDSTAEENKLNRPHGLAIDSNDNLFVADTGNKRIVIYDSQGEFERSFQLTDNAKAAFVEPWDLAFDSIGDLQVIDRRNAILIGTTNKGDIQHVAAARVKTNHLMGFNQPVDIHVDNQDRIYITDQLNRRFSVWQLLTDSYLAEKPIRKEDIERLEKFIKSSQLEFEQQQLKKALEESKRKKTLVSSKKSKDKSPRKSYPKVTCPNCKRVWSLVYVP